VTGRVTAGEKLLVISLQHVDNKVAAVSRQTGDGQATGRVTVGKSTTGSQQVCSSVETSRRQVGDKQGHSRREVVGDKFATSSQQGRNKQATGK